MKFDGATPFVLGLMATLAFGWWVFPKLLYTSEPQPVQFSHALHTSDRVGLTCQDCHGIDEKGVFAGIPQIAQCASCHSEVAGTTPEEKHFVDDFVKPNHEVPWREYARQPDNAYFSHVYHVKSAGIECARCHGGHGSTSALRPLQVNVISGYSRDISGSSISGFPWNPSDGMKMSDCVACHKEHARRSACIDCHK